MTTGWKTWRAQSPPSPPEEERGPQAPPSLASAQDFAEVFDGYFSEIHGYIARRLGTGAADDIAAETFLIAYRRRSTYDAAAGSVRAWLYGIATRQVSRHRRDETRAYRALQRIGPGVVAEDLTEQATDRVLASALQGQLAAALAALSPGDRDVLLLVALADLSHVEVAAALGIPYGTVGSRLSRARRKLRTALASPDTKDPQE